MIDSCGLYFHYNLNRSQLDFPEDITLESKSRSLNFKMTQVKFVFLLQEYIMCQLDIYEMNL